MGIPYNKDFLITVLKYTKTINIKGWDIVVPTFKNTKGISEKVADYLKEQILNGVYIEGDRIPGERDMALKFDVSRNTIREAYKILEAYGYLNAKHGRGFYIASEADQIRKMTESFFISSNQISDLFAVRRLLEERIVEWATINGTEKQIEKLESIVKDSEEVIGNKVDSEKLSEYDLKFHLCLAEMSGNSVANRLMHHLIDLLAQTQKQTVQIPKRIERSVREHLEIVKGIKSKDVKLASKAMKNHLDSVEQEIKQLIAKKDV